MAIKGIKMVHVISEDVQETRKFYRDVLGMNELHPIEGESSFGEQGRAQIWPMPNMSDGQEGSPKPGDVLVVLSCDDVRKDYEEMTSKGAEFVIPPSNPYGPWEAHLRDPNGLWITLIEI